MPQRAHTYKRYPAHSIILYNGITILHYLLGAWGIWCAYDYSPVAGWLAGLYLLFSMTEMYVLMPLLVCPNCVYFRMDDSLCISGLNRLSRRISDEGDTRQFASRAQGVFCSNNRYLAALIVPVLAIIVGLVLTFSLMKVSILLALVILLLYRFFVIFPKVACVHCLAKFICPQAEAMGVREK